MEGKNLIKLIFIAVFSITTLLTAEAQFKDARRFTSSVHLGALPIRVSGVMEKNNPNTSIIDGNHVLDRPEYAYTDTLGYAANIIALIGYTLPFYANDKWSLGMKVNAGIGYQRNNRATEGLTGLTLDFPQYLYYRNYSGKLDYEISAGYKYTRTALDYHLLLGSAEVYLKRNASVGIYSSLNKYSYYMYFTDGREEPMVSIREFGLKFTYHANQELKKINATRAAANFPKI